METLPPQDDVDEEVMLVDYDQRWPHAFAQEEARLRHALGPTVPIEHIGSTAVPGCLSKPIIDIQVAVPRTEMERIVNAAQRLGYLSFADDRIPHRIYLRLRQRASRFNLQVIDAVTTIAADNIALREHLKTNADARARYIAAKTAAATTHPRLRGYSEAKAATIKELIADARRARA